MAKALEGSIKKWQKIVDFLRYKRWYWQVSCDLNDLEQGAANCPLCQIAYNCEKCIVSTKMGFSCSRTPYTDFKYAQLHGNLTKMKEYAKAEVEFLKSLRG